MFEPGDTATISAMRGGQPVTLPVTVIGPLNPHSTRWLIVEVPGGHQIEARAASLTRTPA